MIEQGEMPPMRPVRADDVIAETRWWESPRRVMLSVGILAVVWTVILLAIHVWHVPYAVLVAIAVVVTVITVGFDVVRWLRKRRRRSRHREMVEGCESEQHDGMKPPP